MSSQIEYLPKINQSVLVYCLHFSCVPNNNHIIIERSYDNEKLWKARLTNLESVNNYKNTMSDTPLHC